MNKPNIIMEEIEKYEFTIDIRNENIDLKKIKKNLEYNLIKNKINLKYDLECIDNKIVINYNSIKSNINNINLFLLKEINKYNKPLFIYKIDTNKYINNLNLLKKYINKLPAIYSIDYISVKKLVNTKKYIHIKTNNLKEHLFLIIKLTGNPEEYNINSVVENFIKSYYN